jgi:hypothetical protein
MSKVCEFCSGKKKQGKFRHVGWDHSLVICGREFEVDLCMTCIYLALHEHIPQMTSVSLVTRVSAATGHGSTTFFRKCSSPYHKMTSGHTNKKSPQSVKHRTPDEIELRLSRWRQTPFTVAVRLSLLTYTRSWTLLEEPPIVQPLKNFPAFYGTRRFTTKFTRALHYFLSWAISIQSTPSHPICTESSRYLISSGSHWRGCLDALNKNICSNIWGNMYIPAWQLSGNGYVTHIRGNQLWGIVDS